MTELKSLAYFAILIWFWKFSCSTLLVLCETPREPDGAVASTSGASGAWEVGPTLDVDLSVYKSSSKRLDQDTLEEELTAFYNEALAAEALEASSQTSVMHLESDEEDGQVLRSIEEQAAAHKRRRLGGPGDSPGEGTSRGTGLPDSQSGFPVTFLKIYNEFLQTFILDLIIVEAELKVFSSYKLYYTLLWLHRNKMRADAKFLTVLLELWQKRGFKGNVQLKEQMSSYYNDKRAMFASSFFDKYSGAILTDTGMAISFFQSMGSLDCGNIKRGLGILILIFEFDLDMFFSAYLFFLLICSLRELQGLEFSKSFKRFSKNKDMVREKILKIGNPHVIKICESLKRNVFSLALMKIKIPRDEVVAPLAMETINVENFGLRLCLSLFELYLLKTPKFIISDLTLFFGSRMTLAVEIFLALDILNIVKAIRTQLLEIIVALIYDENVHKHVNKRILAMHNVDISNLKVRFPECVAVKSKYPELRGLIQLTDFQIESIKKQEIRKSKA